MRPSRGIGLAALFAIGWLQPGSGSALGADSSWTSPVSGLWFDPSRWTSGVPGAGDRAFFGATGGASEFTVTLGADWSIRLLWVTNQRPVLQTGPHTLSIGETLVVGTGSENTSLVLDGGRVVVAADVGVGNNGSTGTLTIANGAEATVGRIDVGLGMPGSNGTLVVTGPGTTLSKVACCDPSIGLGAGTGSLVIKDGAAVSLSLGFVGIGREGGQGLATVMGGGSLAIAQGSLGVGAGISGLVPGNGSLLVSGSGSTITVDDQNVFAGSNGGVGSISMTDGASLSVGTGELFVGLGSSPIGPGVGDLSMSGASFAGRNLVVGGPSGLGEALIADGSSVLLTETLRIGHDGGTGAVTLASGAEATIGLLGLGTGGTGANGTLVVTGKGTTLSKIACCDPSIGIGAGNSGALTIEEGAAVSLSLGFVGIGREGGQGTVEVTSGGALSVSQGGLGIGPGISGTVPGVGSLLVAGPGSLVSVADNNVVVGSNGGTGALSLSDGASMGIGTGECSVGFGSSPIGPGMGTMTMSAAALSGRNLSFGVGAGIGDGVVADGSSVVLSEWLRCNRGEVQVESGSSLSSVNAVVADGSGTSAVLRVRGKGTSLGSLSAVGVNGNGPAAHGVLEVSDGAHVSSRDQNELPRFAFVGFGNDPATLGTATVSGPGSRWDGIDWLTVGGVFHTDNPGKGELFILDGGVVESIRGIVSERSQNTGTVVVDGAGSRWTIANDLVLSDGDGNGGVASLTVSSGGAVTCGQLLCGQLSTLSLELRMSGSPAITASGTATLNGALIVTVDPDAPPMPGESVVLIEAGSFTGAFDTITVPAGYAIAASSTSLSVLRVPQISGLSIAPQTIGLAVGFPGQASATVFFKDGGSLDVTALAQWSVSDPTKALVGAGGALLGLAKGSTTLTASFEGFEAAAALNVGLAGFPNDTELITITADGQQAEVAPFAETPKVSADGRYVLFRSRSTVFGASPSITQAFLKDRVTGTLELVSVDSQGTPASSSVQEAAVSGDGRFVVFVAGGAGFVPVAAVDWEVWLRDRQTGVTELISVTTAGAPSMTNNLQCDVSDDGRFVVFNSVATDLVDPPVGVGQPLKLRIFVRDRVAGTTTLLSQIGGEDANASSIRPRISGDGRFVTFQTDATNLAPGDTNGFRDVFVCEIATGTIELVTVSTSGAIAVGGQCFNNEISFDGSLVTFSSDATNLVEGHNGVRHIYLRNRNAGTTTVMSTSESGELSSGPSGSNAISEDGTHVAFRTSGGLVKEDTNGANDVYRRRIADGALELITRSAIDGSPLGSGVWTGLNGDGSLVAFQSDSPLVVPFDQNGVADIFARTMPVPALGDLDFDGDVDAADLAILLGAWGTAAADLNGDGVTDAADLAILLGAWTS